MIISIFASIGSKNLGDELILKNEIKILEKRYPKNTKFLVFSYDYKNPFFKKSNIEYKQYFPIGINNKKNIFKNILNFIVFIKTIFKSDLIVIGGGGLFFDNEVGNKKNPLDLWIFRIIFFRFFRKKIEFFRIGINIKEKNNLFKLKKIFKKAYKISTRDIYSHQTLKNLDIDSEILYDPVFYDNGDKKEKLYLIKKVNSFEFNINDLDGIDFESKKVALALRSGYFSKDKGKLNEKFEEGKINELINYILGKGGEIILLPHSFHKTDELSNDYKFLSKFLRINEKIRIINSMEGVYSTYLYKEFDICFAMRLHSIILSQVYNIPFIGISYSKKTDEILKTLNNKQIGKK